MRNKLTKHIVRGVVSVMGVVMLPLGSAVAADLSPQDRCAIAKLEATWQEAKCLAEAQTEGIRGLTDEQVNRREAACKQREHTMFDNAEGRPGKCKTVNDDAVVDYALKLATDMPRACGESGPPCNANNPATLSDATIRNRTSTSFVVTVEYWRFFPFCNKDRDRTTVLPEQTGKVSAGACAILFVRAEAPGEHCREYHSFEGTWFRTFQVVPDPGFRCAVNRP